MKLQQLVTTNYDTPICSRGSHFDKVFYGHFQCEIVMNFGICLVCREIQHIHKACFYKNVNLQNTYLSL